jgi:hypothetical protein
LSDIICFPIKNNMLARLLTSRANGTAPARELSRLEAVRYTLSMEIAEVQLARTGAMTVPALDIDAGGQFILSGSIVSRFVCEPPCS